MCLIAVVGASCGKRPSHNSFLVDTRLTAPFAAPGWAVQLPEAISGLVAVGYSPLARVDRSMELALEKGYQNLASARSTLVRADQYEVIEVGGGTRFIFPFEMSSETYAPLEDVRRDAVVLDSFTVHLSPGSEVVRTYVLLGLGDASVPLDPQVRQASTFDAGHPGWFGRLPERDGFYFGVGACGFFPDVARSWGKAEQLARLDLAIRVGVKTGNYLIDEQTDTRSRYEELREQHVEVTLSSCLIVARHYDPQRRMFYALARMPVGSQTAP